MPGSVLHIKLGNNFAQEAMERLAPCLASVVQRTVTDAASIESALREREWAAVISDDRTPYSFLDSLPGMACQIRLDMQGALQLPYVSEGSIDLLGLNPAELEQNPQQLTDFLHPDDAASFHQSMLHSREHATPWNWEGRIILPPGDIIKWVNLRAKYYMSNTQGTHWKGFIVNITQNKLAEIEITQYSQRLRELSSHIESIKEEERLRIAREIHDEIGVLLTALKMDLSWMKQRFPAGDDALQEKAQDMSRLLDTAGKSANNLVHSLRPGSLDCFGIVAAIEIEANEFTKRTGIPCKVSRSKGGFSISDAQSITLFRIFQEAMNNIMKHAAAKHVEVKILKADDKSVGRCIELIVADDGCGFDETEQDKPRSFGLRGIKERIALLGGKLAITSQPGKGTKITVRLPITVEIN